MSVDVLGVFGQNDRKGDDSWLVPDMSGNMNRLIEKGRVLVKFARSRDGLHAVGLTVLALPSSRAVPTRCRAYRAYSLVAGLVPAHSGQGVPTVCCRA